MDKMNKIKDDLMSISSNSLSNNSDVPETHVEKNKKATQKKSKVRYALQVAHVPKRTFHHIQRRINKNKPVINIKTETTEKTNCNRFILSHVDGNQMENISPESITRLVWEMRDRLQRKEYGELAKLISIFTEMPSGKARWFPTLIKYCLIVLMYDPLVQGSGLMEMFLDGVMGCRSAADRAECLREINRLPTNIHVTKYDELWEEYPLPNQINQKTLDQMCKILNERDAIKTERESDSDSDSEWESYDENDSNEENHGTTTEAEKVNDFDDIVNQLQMKFTK